MKQKITLIMLLIFVCYAKAQTVVKIKGNLPNPGYYTSIKDNYLYVTSTSASTFERYDLNNINTPPNSYNFFDSQNMIRINGEHLYFASYSASNIIRRPLNSLTVASNEVVINLNRATSLDFNGIYMYAIDFENGIYRYDMSVSDPQSTETMIVSGAGFRDLKIVNNNLFFISQNALFKKNLSTSSTTDFVQLFDGLGFAQSIAHRGNFLYLSQFNNGGDIIRYDILADSYMIFATSDEYNNAVGLSIFNNKLIFTGSQNVHPFESAIFSVDLTEDPYIHIPDVNFEQALIDLGHDSGSLDGFISQVDANNILSLSLNNKGINSLEGIRYFNSLEELFALSNNLSSLDLRFVNNISNLKKLYVGYNNIEDLNIENNLTLEELNVVNNELISLDLSNHTQLKDIYVGYNQLTNLGDLSNLNVLKNLFFNNNNISSIDITNNSALEVFDSSDNNLVALDLSNNNFLEEVNVSFNLNLESLNIKNGNNTIITDFASGSTPNLTCIEVDDPTYSTSNWISRDPNNSFSNNCISEICSFDSNDDGIITTENFSTTTLNVNIGTDENYDIGQSFMACNTGVLKNIGVLMLNSFGPGGAYDITIKVYEGAGNSGNLLGTVNNLSAFHADEITDRSIFHLSEENIQVVSGQVYTFYISSPYLVVNSRITSDVTGSIYSNGELYNYNTPIPNQELFFSVSIGDNATLGVDDFNHDEELYFYPNPTTDIIYIKNLKNRNQPFKIYSILGEVILEGENTNDEINISNFKSGIYLLDIEGFKPVRVIKK